MGGAAVPGAPAGGAVAVPGFGARRGEADRGGGAAVVVASGWGAMGPVWPGSSMVLRSARRRTGRRGARPRALRGRRCGGWPRRRTRRRRAPAGAGLGVGVHGAAVDERGVAVGGRARRAGSRRVAGSGRWRLRGPAARPLRPDGSDSPAASVHLGVGLAVRAPRGGRAAAAGCPGVGAAVAPRGRRRRCRAARPGGPPGRLLPVAAGSAAGPGSRVRAATGRATGRGDRAVGGRAPRRVAPVVLGDRAVATPRRRSGGAAVRTHRAPTRRGHVGGRSVRRQAPTRWGRRSQGGRAVACTRPPGPPLAGAAAPSPPRPPGARAVRRRGRTVARTPARPGHRSQAAAGPSPAPHAAGPPFAGAAEPCARTPRARATVGWRGRTVAAAPGGRAAIRGAVRVVAGAPGAGAGSTVRRGVAGPRPAGAGGAVRRCGPAVGACRGLGGSPRRPGAVDRREGAAVRRLAGRRGTTAGRSARPGRARWPVSHRRPPGTDPLVGRRRDRPACRRGLATDGGERAAARSPRPSTAGGCAVAERRVGCGPAGGAVRAGCGVSAAGGARPRARPRSRRRACAPCDRSPCRRRARRAAPRRCADGGDRSPSSSRTPCTG